MVKEEIPKTCPLSCLFVQLHKGFTHTRARARSLKHFNKSKVQNEDLLLQAKQKIVKISGSM